MHSPEFPFERDPGNVAQAVKSLGITYPVAIDSNLAICRAFNNEYWPAEYLIGASGNSHSQHFGEGDYAQLEMEIQQLLTEVGNENVPSGTVTPGGTGAEAAAGNEDMHSPETYIGYNRAQNFESPQDFVPDAFADYTFPAQPDFNAWALQGNWKDEGEMAVLGKAGGGILFRFSARDLHLVLGPGAGNHPIRFRVLLDGAPPGADHGSDTDSQENGIRYECPALPAHPPNRPDRRACFHDRVF